MGDPVDQLLTPAYHHLHFQNNYQTTTQSQPTPQPPQNEIFTPSLYRNPSPSPSQRNSPSQDLFRHIHDVDSANITDHVLDDQNVDEEPLYVNANQYFRILKRRVARARLEEVHRLSRQRKVCLLLPSTLSLTPYASPISTSHDTNMRCVVPVDPAAAFSLQRKSPHRNSPSSPP